MITLDNVIIEYEQIILKNISLEFKKGRSYVIYGKSGAGKSSLINAIFGLKKPKYGNIYIDGISINDKRSQGFIRGNTIAYIAQEIFLIESLSVIENICMPALLVDKKHDYKKIVCDADVLLEKMGLKQYRDKNISKLSGGEQRRVEIIRALMQKTKCIIADEITANLDDISVDIILSTLREYVLDGGTLIMTSHDPRVKKISDFCLLIENKEVLFVE